MKSTMPRAERIKKTTAKELSHAASQPGQSKLSASFFQQEKVQAVEDTMMMVFPWKIFQQRKVLYFWRHGSNLQVILLLGTEKKVKTKIGI